jgi:hypothetical protein
MEQFNYLETLRLRDKYTRNPTSLELAQAFKDNRDIARRCMDELIKEVAYYKDLGPLMRCLMSINPKVIRINELQRFLNLTSPISNNRIDTTKAKAYPIEEMYDFQKVRRSAKRIQCSCPFHTDDKPSFVVYLESNTCHCFSCQFNGDSISFAQKLYNESFINAVRRLSQ